MNENLGQDQYRPVSEGTRNKGFTLMEIVIAVFFVAVTLVAIIEIFNLDFISADNIREHLKAASRAQDITEKVSRTKNFNPASYPPGSLEIDPMFGSTLVTVNVSWQNVKSKGSVELVKEFFE